jgi:hypothetical protein
VGLGLAGRLEEARRTILEMREAPRIPAFQPWIEYLLAWIDRRPADMKLKVSMLRSFRIMEDPEAIFEEGWLLCDVGEHERALEYLRRAIDKGYFVAPTLAGRPQFDALRGDPRFQAILADAEEGRRRALVAFREAGGERLLGR